ncbi:myosin-9-like [Cololabis saira]|uniref:myosin-9-like n=1 Tax=Cololabis saira TaxID=129043 RepID=UPI002AD47D3A|nr:myosin-9-like [Cololabis saira]
MAKASALESTEKDRYLARIKHLEEQLAKCELSCEEEEKKKADNLLRLSKLQENKVKIQRLKSAVSEEEKEIRNLYKQLKVERCAAREAGENSEARQQRHALHKLHMQENIQQLEAKAAMEAVALDDREEKLTSMRQEVSGLETMQKQVAEQEETYRSIISSMRTQAEAEELNHADKYLEKMESWLKQKVVEMEKPTQGQCLIGDVEEKVVLLQGELDELEGKIAVMLSRKETKALKKLKQQRSALETDVSLKRRELSELLAERNSVRSSEAEAAAAAARQDQSSGDEERRRQAAALRELEVELQEQRSTKQQLGDGIQEAAIILRHTLQQTDTASQTGMIRRLVEILDSYAPQGHGGQSSHVPAEGGRSVQYRRRRTQLQTGAASQCQQQMETNYQELGGGSILHHHHLQQHVVHHDAALLLLRLQLRTLVGPCPTGP